MISHGPASSPDTQNRKLEVSAMVGDSGNDVDAARAAGCPVLVVPYGYNEGRPVQILKADGIVPSLAAVADRVVRIATRH